MAETDRLEDVPWVDAQHGGVGVLVSWTEPGGGLRLASAGTDRTVRVWDPEVGTPIGEPLLGHTAVVGCLATWLAADGTSRLASAGEDHTIRIWDPATGAGTLPPLTGHTEWVMGLTAWQAPGGGAFLASAGIDATVRRWDAELGAPLGPPLTGHTGGLWAITHYPAADGSIRLASGGDDGSVRIWDAATGDQVAAPLAGHPSGLLSLLAVPGDDGIVLVSGGVDGHLRFWDEATGQLIGVTNDGHAGTIRSLTSWLTPAGDRHLASAGADGTIRIWDANTRQAVGSPLTGHSGWMPAITSWTGAGGDVRLASAGDGGTIRIWDPRTGVDSAPPLLGHVAGMWALASWVRPDGTPRLAAAGDDAVIRILNPDTGAPVGIPLTGHTAGLWALTSWGTDDGGSRLASAGDDGTVRIWDAETGTPVHAPLETGCAWIPGLTTWVLADGTRYLAAGGMDGRVRVWDTATAHRVADWKTGQKWVLSVAAWRTASGESRLATGGDDGTIRVWEPLSGAPAGGPWTGHPDWVRVLTSWGAPDGKPGLASAGFDGTVRIWDPETGQPAGAVGRDHSNRVGGLTSWVDAAGRPRLASGSDDDTVRVWDATTGLPVGGPLVGHTSGVWAVTSWLQPDGTTRLASSGYDGSVRLWDPETGESLRTIEVGPLTLWGLSDAPAGQDLLGREVLARAIAEQLHRPASTGAGPVVVSIEGPWGSGKSTLMRMVREQLPGANPPASPAGPPPLTVRQAIRALRGHRPEPAPPPPTRLDGVVTAWFNPWAHQSGEQVWAGLVSEIIEASAAVLYPTEDARETYWFTRNLERVDRFALQRVLVRRAASPILGLGLVAVALPLILSLAELDRTLNIFGQRWTWAAIAFVAAMGFVLVGAGHTVVRYFFGRAVRYLPGELFQLPVTGGFTVAEANGRAESIGDPLRRAEAGTLYLVQHDVGRLLADLEAAGHQLVVFVDDLDRCRPATTAEVFEAVNLFLSGLTTSTELRARFVIGLDPTAVAAQLTGYLGDRADQPFAEDASSGWAFLRKLIQLPVLIPTVSPDAVRRFVEEVTGRRVLPPSATDPAPAAFGGARPPHARPVPSPAQEPARSQFSGRAPVQPVAVAHAASSASASVSAPASPTRIIPWRSLENHPDITGLLIERLTAQREPSVRESKRLLNVWQLYERILTAVDPLDQASALRRARHLVLVAEIITRWPALQGSLHRRIKDRTGLQSLAAAAGDDTGWAAVVEATGLPVGNDRALLELRRLLVNYDGRAVADLASAVL